MPRWVRWTGLALFVVFAAVAAAHRYHTGTIPGDFEVFWRAGGRFLGGEPLYPAGPIDTAFLYPPFAALLFQGLALVPLSLAAAIASFANTLLYATAVWLTWDIVRGLLPEREVRLWPLLLVSAILSIRYFQNNATWIQTNLLTLVLVLGGVAAGRRERWFLAAGLIAAAAGIKVVPAVFLVWLLIRGPLRRVGPATLAALLAVVVIPLVWRGPAQGWLDLMEYLRGFLSEYLSGGVRIRWDNYNLATLAYGLFVPLHDPSGAFGPWLPGGATAGAWLYRVSALLVAGVWLWMVVDRRRLRADWSAPEVAATFLAALLLSGVTWLHHLVPLLFVFTAMLVMRKDSLRWRRGLLWLALLMAAVAGLGRDAVSPSVYDAIRVYRVVTVFLLVAFATMVMQTLRPPAEGCR